MSAPLWTIDAWRNGLAETKSPYAPAIAAGRAGRAKGVEGSPLFALERDDNNVVISTASGIVGNDGLKPATEYVCKDGKLVEASK